MSDPILNELFNGFHVLSRDCLSPFDLRSFLQPYLVPHLSVYLEFLRLLPIFVELAIFSLIRYKLQSVVLCILWISIALPHTLTLIFLIFLAKVCAWRLL